MLLVATTLVLTTGFAVALFSGLVGPQEDLVSKLEVRLVQDDCPWGNGEERIQMRHIGGEPLPAATTTVHIGVGPMTHSFSGETQLGPPFDTQGRLAIGDTWRSPQVTIDPGALVLIDIVSRNGDAILVYSETLNAPRTCVEGVQ